MDTLQDFLETIPNEDNQRRLENVVEWVLETFPSLELQIKWNQPMMVHNGTFIIAFSAASKHFTVAPEVQVLNEFRGRITEAGYSASKMLVRIRWNQTVDYALLDDIVTRSIEFKQGSKTFWAQ